MTHGQALRSALLTISGMGHRAWARQVGLFIDMRGRHRRIGVKGEPDIQGTLRGGWALFVEIKTGNATRSAEQTAFGKMITGLGACYIVARYSDSSDGDAAIKAGIEEFLARQGESAYSRAPQTATAGSPPRAPAARMESSDVL